MRLKASIKSPQNPNYKGKCELDWCKEPFSKCPKCERKGHPNFIKDVQIPNTKVLIWSHAHFMKHIDKSRNDWCRIRKERVKDHEKIHSWRLRPADIKSREVKQNFGLI